LFKYCVHWILKDTTKALRRQGRFVFSVNENNFVKNKQSR